MSDLTEFQTKFLELIFQPQYIGNEKQAAIDAGYSPNTQLLQIYDTLKRELIEKADTILARKIPKSINGIESVLDNPDQKGAKAKLEAATIVLDRVGISKRDRMEIEIKNPSGVFIIPAKKD